MKIFTKDFRKKFFESWKKENVDALAKAEQERKNFGPVIMGKYLRKCREMHGLSLEDVAEILGGSSSRSSLSMIELGRQNIRLEDYFFLKKLYSSI